MGFTFPVLLLTDHAGQKSCLGELSQGRSPVISVNRVRSNRSIMNGIPLGILVWLWGCHSALGSDATWSLPENDWVQPHSEYQLQWGAECSDHPGWCGCDGTARGQLLSQ